MPVKISDRIGTFGESDVYATGDANRQALGFHAVNSLSERNQIPLDRRRGTYQEENELPYPFFVSVRTDDEVKLYWLKDEPLTDTTEDEHWEEFIAGYEEPFQGFFDPNTSTLVDGVGTKGHYWIAEGAGTFNSETYAQYDKTIYDGSVWKKIGSTTVVADWNTMTNKPSSFTPIVHSHPINQISGLQVELDNKVDLKNTESTVSGDVNNIPNSKAIVDYSYSKGDVDSKLSNLATYGIKYSWSNITERNITTGMVVGDLGLRTDENKVYKWSGTSWSFFFNVNYQGFLVKDGAGTIQSKRAYLQFIGATVTDNEAEDVIEVTINADALLPSQTGNASKFLTTDGTNSSWETVNALPNQTDNNGKYLKTDGANATWEELTNIESTDDISTEGSTNKWWTNARTIGAILTGYTKALSSAAILTTDTILVALGKLEKKVDDVSTSTQRSGATITFDVNAGSYYGTNASPETGGTISLAGSGNVSGNTIVLFHSGASQPTLPSACKIVNGNYLNGFTNIITMTYYSPTYIITTILPA